MKGPTIIFLVAVFLLLIVAYLAQDTEPEESLGSKAYHMLLLVWMKADITLAYGMRYVRIAVAQICGVQRLGGMDETIQRKQQRMEEYRRMNQCGQEYKKRQRYNRRILQ